MISIIRSEIRKALSGLVPTAVGEIAELDLAAYQAKCKLKTSGQLTNWLRIGTDHSGDGAGMVTAPNIGDEVLIEFLEWNPSGPGIVVRRLYGKDAPPALGEDEVHFLHKSGTDVLIKKDGSIVITGVKTSDSSYKSDVSDSTEGKRSLSSKGDATVHSDAKVTISAGGVVDITGVPTINLNGSSFSAVIFEQLQTALMTFQGMVAAHLHIGNLGAPTGPPVPPPTLVLTPAQSQKVKLGG